MLQVPRAWVSASPPETSRLVRPPPYMWRTSSRVEPPSRTAVWRPETSCSRWEPGSCREWRVTSHGLHFLFLFTASWTFSFSHAFLILETQQTSYVSYRGSNDSLFSRGFPFLVPSAWSIGGKMSIVFLSPLREALSFLVWESKWCYKRECTNRTLADGWFTVTANQQWPFHLEMEQDTCRLSCQMLPWSQNVIHLA